MELELFSNTFDMWRGSWFLSFAWSKACRARHYSTFCEYIQKLEYGSKSVGGGFGVASILCEFYDISLSSLVFSCIFLYFLVVLSPQELSEQEYHLTREGTANNQGASLSPAGGGPFQARDLEGADLALDIWFALPYINRDLGVKLSHKWHWSFPAFLQVGL